MSASHETAVALSVLMPSFEQRSLRAASDVENAQQCIAAQLLIVRRPVQCSRAKYVRRLLVPCRGAVHVVSEHDAHYTLVVRHQARTL